jgi:hypothetical protein
VVALERGVHGHAGNALRERTLHECPVRLEADLNDYYDMRRSRKPGSGD